MTEFISRKYGNGGYEIIIKTDSHEHYRAAEDFARRLIDHAKPMTDREKLIGLVKRAITDWEHGDVSERIADHLIKNGVVFATDNNVGTWIPVTERLPEPGLRVLATDCGFVGEFYINKRGQWRRYNVNDSSMLMALDILCWMPMPEAPKEE